MIMRFSRRDLVATGLVAAAGLTYALWAIDSTVPGLHGTRASGTVVLVLGFLASASAVVPTFDRLLRGNRVYLVGTALVGLVALAGGMAMLVAASRTGLAVLMAAMAVLWLVATVHHMMLTAAPTAPWHRANRGHALTH